MQRSRANGLLIAVLAIAALVLSVYCLNHAPDPAMVARWWPATSLVTVMLILAPHYARQLAGLAALIFFAASLYAGLDIAFALGFAIANAVEAMLVLRWLTGFEEERPQLRSWTDFRRWLIGLTVASAAAGAITAMTIGITGGEELWRPMLWITITHLGAQMVVLPLVMGHPRQKVKVSVLEVAQPPRPARPRGLRVLRGRPVRVGRVLAAPAADVGCRPVHPTLGQRGAAGCDRSGSSCST